MDRFCKQRLNEFFAQIKSTTKRYVVSEAKLGAVDVLLLRNNNNDNNGDFSAILLK